jgi:hypothetical protein
MSRPRLHGSLSSSEFAAWYWLKKELIDFCRTVGLPASGSKQEIAQRIALWLDDKDPPPVQLRKRDVMPVIFELTTVVGTGWRLTKALRGFFENECGKRFHFNGALREFFATQANAGKTLADAVKVYQDSLQKDAITTIAPQFEYNRHCRDFFANHPGATRAEAIAAWRKKRNARRL